MFRRNGLMMFSGAVVLLRSLSGLWCLDVAPTFTQLFSRRLATALLSLIALPAAAVSPDMVISQGLWRAGCPRQAAFDSSRDYVELFNRSGSAVSINGWSVQYAGPPEHRGRASR